MTAQAQPLICLVGYGHWGRNLARNFAELGHLYAVCDSNPEYLRACAAAHPGSRLFTSFQEVLEDPAIDAVVLATPAEQHFRMALAALDAGKDLFVEKPLALECEHGAMIVAKARQAGRILMVGHLLKYHPAFRKIQELAAQGVLGPLEYIYSNRLSMGKIRQQENALWSFAPHDISLILTLMGTSPVQVTATGGAYLQPNIADITLSTLLFDNGGRAHIFVSWLHPYKEQRLVVIGKKQMVAFEDTRLTDKLILFDKRIEWKNGVIEAGKSMGTALDYDKEEPLRLECAHFIDCVRSRREPATPGEEGVRVLEVLQACQRSLQMNGEPVQVGALTARGVMRL